MGKSQLIAIETEHAALSLLVDHDQKLIQSGFGSKAGERGPGKTYCPTYGNGWTLEPAFSVVHSDGNTSLDLTFETAEKRGELTKIVLKDPQYPFYIDLYFQAYVDEDVIETWSEVRHRESGPVTLKQFASSSPDFGLGDFYLTQFRGEWADEANLTEEKLCYGLKTLSSKLGVRANQFLAPWFLLAKGCPAEEDRGEVWGGSLAWSGSFSFKFEVDPAGSLRAICGINEFASEYHLDPGEVFQTPKMVWGWSGEGTGKLSQNLHRWVRRHALRDGNRPRPILLNNWEATYFAFDEEKIVSLFDGARDLGLELFLLDDGWFGSKFPRDGDTQGLGDWTPDPKKLPHGLQALAEAAAQRELRFGIWLEPEMVSPGSELFEKHPEWVIGQPKRELDLQRHQLVLDLSRPEVKEFVFEVANQTLLDNPGISYVKWDCNRYLTQPGSFYLPADKQSHLWIYYVRNLYEIFERLVAAHPTVEIMMCSGGGGRVDYGASRFAQEIWPSDMTDPVKRIFIQWGFSYFFPAISISDHVTDSGHRPLKFSFDVAMSGRLGMDLDLDGLTPEERDFVKRAISGYKQIRNLVQMGDLYRLESPYDGPRSALMFVDNRRAVLFVYSLGEVPSSSLKLKGLETENTYRVREINVADGSPALSLTISGDLLLTQGIEIPVMSEFSSLVFEISPL